MENSEVEIAQVLSDSYTCKVQYYHFSFGVLSYK